jgi:FecR-like protein
MDLTPHQDALLEAFLHDPATWGSERPESQDQLLELLSGSPEDRDAVLLPSEDEQREFRLLDEAIREWDRRPPRVSPELSERLRGLQDLDEGARESLPVVRVLGTASSRVVGEGRRSSQRRRARATTARLSRGGSARRKKSTTSKRRTGASLRVAEARSSSQPQYLLGVLAAAAGLLVALAAALHMSESSAPRQLPSNQTAKVDGRRGPLVSDLQGKSGGRAERPSATKSDERAPQPERHPVDRRQADSGDSSEREPLAALPREEHSEEAAPSDSPERSPQGKTDATKVRETPVTEPSLTPTTRPRWSTLSPGGQGQVALDLRRVRGAVALARPGEDFQPLNRAQVGSLDLQPGDRIRSKSGGFVSLEEGAYEICLDSGTEFVVRGAAAGPRLGLASGRLHCEVRSLPSGERFTVATDRGDLRVLGTIFAVEASDQETRVLVREGTVSLSGLQGREVKVGAGKSSAVSEGAPTPPAAYRPRELAWAKRYAPKRQLLYAVNFNDRKLGGFRGELARDAESGRALVLDQTKNNPYWGLEATIPAGRIAGFRPGPDVYVQFSVFVEDSAPVLFQTYNDKQKKEFKASFHHPGGYWRTFTVPLLSLSTYVDPGKNPVQAGDLFTDLEIYVGNAGSKQRVLLDDVQIYQRRYQ